MTRIGRWPPCTTSRPLSFSSSRLPASANSLLGTSMSTSHCDFGASAGTPQDRHPLAQGGEDAVVWRLRERNRTGSSSDTELSYSSIAFTMTLLSTGHVKEPDPLCARPVEHVDRFGRRLQ